MTERRSERPAGARDEERFDYATLRLRNKQTSKSPRSLLKLLAGALRTVLTAARRQFLVTMVLTVLGGLLPIAQVVVTMLLLSALLAGQGDVRIGPLMPLLVALAVLSTCSFGLTVATSQLQRLIGARVMRDTHRKVLGVTTTVPLDTYETPWFFNYVARIEANALTKPHEIAQAIVTIAAGAVAGTGLAIVLLIIDPLLLPLLAITALPNRLAGRRGSRAEFDFAVEQSASVRERNYLATVLKLRDTAKEVRAFELAGLLLSRWQHRYNHYLAGLRTVVGTRLRLSLLAAVSTGALLLIAMLVLLWRVGTGYVTLAEAGAALIAMRMLAARMQTTAAGGNRLYESQLFLQDLHEFLELGERLSGPTEADVPRRQVPGTGFERHTVDAVSYSYPGSDTFALDGVSLEIRRGEIVALVGENGSGKTTLAKILAGLHEPTAGTLYWDEHPVTGMDPASLRRHIAVIFQDFARYELSALDNIAVGRAGDAPDVEAVRRAARQAGAAEFIEALPHGYETLLGKMLPGGVDLSLGQWQRIALARAIYRDAEFVVLDEPTSALDPRAEQEMFARMRAMFLDRTVLLISHRFSSVRYADRIYVLDSGRVVESGTHDDLMRRDGTYRELFTLQAAAYHAG